MRRKLVFILVTFILTLLTFYSIPIEAETTWGFEIDENYVYELDKLIILGTPLQYEYMDETRRRVVFNDFNDTGYSYSSFNTTNFLGNSSTVFLPISIDNETSLVLPQGMPMALPLSINEIPDYLDYFGQAINQTESLLVFDNITPNITDYMNETYRMVFSSYDNSSLSEHIDLYSPSANNSLIEALLQSINLESNSFVLPTNFTYVQLNITSSFDSVTGLFDCLEISLSSLTTDEYGYTTSFDIEIRYEMYKQVISEFGKLTINLLVSSIIGLYGTFWVNRRKKNNLHYRFHLSLLNL